MSTESRELPELQDIIASMRNFAAVADTCQLTEGNAPAAIGVWADMLEALAHSRAQDSGGYAVLLRQARAVLVRVKDDDAATVVNRIDARLSAAEQPAKGEKWRCACGDLNYPNETCAMCNQSAPQPSDPADAVLAQARREFRDSDAAGDVLDWLEERLATPPTALAHSRAQDSGGEMVAIVCERGTVSWRAERILPVGTKLYTAAEQPAKGEGVDVEATDMGTYTDYAFPQPSDPADADALMRVHDGLMAAWEAEGRNKAEASHGRDLWDWAQTCYYAARRRQHTPPTAQRHGPAAWMTPEAIAHLAKQNGVAKVDAWNCASGTERVPVYLPSAHGAGAAVEAVAWALINHCDGDRVSISLEPISAEQRANLGAAYSVRPLIYGDTQQRSEQVAGGGGVDALPAKWRQRADSMWASYGGECRRCANELEAALSTQPLLSDQPAGVSNGVALRKLAAMWERHAREYIAAAEDASNGLSDELRLEHRVREAMCKHHAAQLRAALHPEQAKDGDV